MADDLIVPPVSSPTPDSVLGPPGLAGGSAQGGFSFTAIVAALQTIGQGLWAIQQVIKNNFVNLAANNVFTGTNTFQGIVTFTNRVLFQSGENHKVRVVTVAGGVTVTTADFIVVINKTVGAATAVALPASPTQGDEYWIKDGKGDAGANNITITPAAGNIDGSATLVINTNYGVARLVYSTQWNQI